MGLPEVGATRDGVLNTNNWIESAFKTFKAIFLGGKKNRRYVATVALRLLRSRAASFAVSIA
jgi:hypothetical protein